MKTTKIATKVQMTAISILDKPPLFCSSLGDLEVGGMGVEVPLSVVVEVSVSVDVTDLYWTFVLTFILAG